MTHEDFLKVLTAANARSVYALDDHITQELGQETVEMLNEAPTAFTEQSLRDWLVQTTSVKIDPPVFVQEEQLSLLSESFSELLETPDPTEPSSPPQNFGFFGEGLLFNRNNQEITAKVTELQEQVSVLTGMIEFLVEKASGDAS